MTGKRFTTSKTHKRQASKSRRTVWLIVCLLGAVLVGGMAFALPLVAGGAQQTALIRVPRYADNQALSDTLTKYLGADYAKKTMKAVKAMKRDVASRNGAYLIKEGTSPLMAARTIMRGMQEPIRLTINGFRQKDVLIDRISAKMEFSADELRTALDDPHLLAEYGVTEDQAIALFLDNTYDFYWNDSPQHVIDKIASNYKSVWNQSRQAKADSLGLTPAEVMTLCSIVDEETNKADEKGAVARLYLNRLEKGMRLQADPTVRYALGDFTIRRVGGEMLQNQSPYNTYRYAGLPPGPIRTTRVETIDAVLNSEPHDYLYMCAKADFSGYHDFSRTFEEHRALARKYQVELNRRGITTKSIKSSENSST